MRAHQLASGVAVAICAILAQAPARALAQDAGDATTVLLFRDPPPQDPARVRSGLRRAAGPLRRDPEALVAAQLPALTPSQLGPLAELDALLGKAAQQAASLDEGAALATLAEALRLAERAAAVPGACAYIAEVELRLGVVAAQAGLSQLAERALRRAASLDPDRRLGAAEATPAIVALAERLKREAATAPRGSFELRSEPSGAAVFLDDRRVGRTPLELSASTGRHLLRLEARGHARIGHFIEVFEGPRPPIEIELAPEPELSASRRLAEAARQGDYAGVAAALGPLSRSGIIETALVVETSDATGRSLLLRCTEAGCRGPVRSSDSSKWHTPLAPLSQAELSLGRTWLTRSPRPAVDPPRDDWWRHWWLWSGAAVIAGAATALAIAVSSGDPRERLRVVVDPSDVGQ